MQMKKPKVIGFMTRVCLNCGNVARSEIWTDRCRVCGEFNWRKVVLDER